MVATVIATKIEVLNHLSTSKLQVEITAENQTTTFMLPIYFGSYLISAYQKSQLSLFGRGVGVGSRGCRCRKRGCTSSGTHYLNRFSNEGMYRCFKRDIYQA